MCYKCEKCEKVVGPGIPQSKIYDKLNLEKGYRIIGEHNLCHTCSRIFIEDRR